MRYPFLALVAGLTACCNPATDSYCTIAKPVYMSKDEVLTRDTLREIVTHNETWAKLCK